MSRDIPTLYGSLVFSDKVMRNKLPKDVYKALHKTIQNGTHLELDVANSVAVAMKEWAVENGATHFTHWFQPMTGYTAEKHDSLTHPVSPPAAFAPPLKPEAIQTGTPRHRLLLKIIHFTYQQHSALSAERHWIKRPRSSVPWRH